MILKSYLVEQNLEALDKYSLVLMYGENEGIKNDFKEKLGRNIKETEIINFFQNEILKNERILIDKISNTSLFNKKKRIFIYEVTDKIYSTISHILENLNKDIKIYLFGAALDRRSKLRSLFEKEKSTAIIACYQDNGRTLVNYIKDKLKGYEGLSAENINLIIENSSLDRQTIKKEIEKIKAFFSDKRLKKQQLEQILNVKLNNNFDELRDATLIGNKLKINKLMSEIEFIPEDNYYYLNSLNLRLNKLIEIKNIDQNKNNSEAVLENLKPKIFWKDKPIYVEQLKKWDLNSLQEAASKIGQTELLMKKNSQIRNDILIKDLLIKLCNQVSSF